ncbi:amidohydrolase family protein [Marinibaculum pumilum]|uniref:Amidohydrolase family protein n=1 Tax=Marinibaculum pumilum TaxID=1766165 RepID=A0ABV7KYC4_9PROT
MSAFDLVIRDGRIVDGSGAEAFSGDVAVRDGRIVEVGKVAGAGRREIAADGRLVTPGFVDIHTHYDGQVTWDSHLNPSSNHGVTTVVMGNCGVGFAPVHDNDHAMLIRLMEGVEDIPGTALAEGLPWSWNSMPDYLDAVDAIPHDLDICAQLPHGALRVFVMGERGADREPATDDDIAAMARLAAEAVEAGAFGFTTSRSLNHQTSDGKSTPSYGAAARELVGIAEGVGRTGRGVLQVISDVVAWARVGDADVDDEFAMLQEMMRISGRPLSLSLSQTDPAPDVWRDILGRITAFNDAGLSMKAQVCGRPIGTLLGLQGSAHPFIAHPTYREIKDLPLAERVAAMRNPDFRARIMAEEPGRLPNLVRHILTRFDKQFRLGDPPDYEPRPETSIQHQAAAQQRDPRELIYDILLENEGREFIYVPLFNYAGFDLEPAREMMLHPHTVLGLGDGGAHCGIICDGSFPTTMMTHWGRDRTRGPKLDLPWIVKAQTSDTAAAVGLQDRGLLKPGYKADINLIDFDRLTLRPPHMIYDLPAGGRRLMQEAEGYDATIVSGEVIMENGAATGALPGRLVRGAQAAPRG